MKKLIGALVAAAIVITAVTIIGINIRKDYIEKHTPSDVVMKLTDFYSVEDGTAMIIIDGDIYEEPALWSSNMAYLKLDFVKQKFTKRFFEVVEENQVIFTTPTKVYRFTPGEEACTVNDLLEHMPEPVIEIKDGVYYVSVRFLEPYGITYRIYSEPNRIMLTMSDEDYLCADCVNATQIRNGRDIKADILKEVSAGEVLRFIDNGGVRENGFIKVMSTDGVRGYIQESCLSDSYYKSPEFEPVTAEKYTHLLYGTRIYMGWQLLYTKESLGYLKEAVANAPEMNVIAPTWFNLTGTDGDMLSYASKDYVKTAHERGIKVWATYKNDSVEGKFSCSEDSHAVLTSTASRTNLVKNIVASVKEYELDGVNIDFEYLKLDSGIYFIQFLRELSVACRLEGIILSVDNYVPENYNAYYDLSEQSELVDYIVIMGYDEHTSGSEEEGSVSSLNWFKSALEKTVAKCDPSRVIMGVPFYTRLWKVKTSSFVVSESPNMADAAKLVKNNGATKVWLDKEGQYYAEWNANGATYKIWLEEEESLRAKTYAVREYDMAGIAAWKLGDETKGIWAAIKDALEGELPVEEEPSAEEE